MPLDEPQSEAEWLLLGACEAAQWSFIRPARHANVGSTNHLYIPNVAQVSDEELLSLLQPFGRVLSIRRNAETYHPGDSYVNVTFATAGAASAALEALDRRVLPVTQGNAFRLFHSVLQQERKVPGSQVPLAAPCVSPLSQSMSPSRRHCSCGAAARRLSHPPPCSPRMVPFRPPGGSRARDLCLPLLRRRPRHPRPPHRARFRDSAGGAGTLHNLTPFAGTPFARAVKPLAECSPHPNASRRSFCERSTLFLGSGSPAAACSTTAIASTMRRARSFAAAALR